MSKPMFSVEWMTEHKQDSISHDYGHISQDESSVGGVAHGPEALTTRAMHTRRGTGCPRVVIDRDAITALRFLAIAPHQTEDFALGRGY
jgi:hypothetical protein